MAKSIQASRRSPLAAYHPITTDDYQQREKPFVGKLIIRGKPEEEAFLQAAEATLSTPLPLAANTTSVINDNTVLWLGPEEWLIWTDDEQLPQQRHGLVQAFADLPAAVVDVSDYYTIIQLTGRQARTVLAHGCPLDLHPDQFRPGDCAQSRFRQASILIRQSDDKPSYDIQVRWSFADYLWNYLAEINNLNASTF